MPIDNIVDFILYVLPGFIATEIYYGHFPARQRSAFTQLAQSVIGGVIVVSALRWIDDRLLYWSLQSAATPSPSPLFVAALLLGGIALGYIMVAQLNLRSYLAKRFPHLAWLSSSPDSIWQFVNQPTVEDWAVVRLKDGPTYLGWISRYRFDPDATDQDFLLSRAKCVDDKLKTLYYVDGIGVYLNTRDVQAIEFVAPPSVPPSRKRTRRAA